MESGTTIHSWIRHEPLTSKKIQPATKSQVFRHVAAHRKLKRQQRTLKLRASALNTLRTLEVPSAQLPTPPPEDLLNGNLDPFDCLAVPLTPEISDLIQFDRIHVEPAFRQSKITLQPSSAFLQDALAAYGYLARIAAVKARCCQDSDALGLMLRFKADAMARLRSSLATTEPNLLARAVLSLIYTENWCQNPKATAVHMRLLENIHTHHRLDIRDMICILHSDVQQASGTLDTTMFVMNEDNWDRLEASCNKIRPHSAAVEVEVDGAPRQILVEMRNALLAIDLLDLSTSTQAVRHSATIKCLHVMSWLLDRYNLSPDVVEKYTALAAFYRIKRAANMEKWQCAGVRIFNCGKILLPRLRQLLESATSDPLNLRLWALAIGIEAGDTWFKEEYTRQAELAACWNSPGRVLDAFEFRDSPRSFAELLGDQLEDGEEHRDLGGGRL
jgi:hypothetical protein